MEIKVNARLISGIDTDEGLDAFSMETMEKAEQQGAEIRVGGKLLIELPSLAVCLFNAAAQGAELVFGSAEEYNRYLCSVKTIESVCSSKAFNDAVSAIRAKRSGAMIGEWPSK